jgi:Na+/proline symporter
LEVYRMVEAGKAPAQLPDWAVSASTLDAVRVHGVSLQMLSKLESAVASGAKTLDEADAALAQDALQPSWAKLDRSVKEAVFGLARETAGKPHGDRWRLFAEKVLPVAASAAGTDGGALNLAAVAVDPRVLPAVLPLVAGLPMAVVALMLGAVFAAAVAGAAALVTAIATSFGHDIARVNRSISQEDGSVWPVRLAALVASAGAAWAALVLPVELDVLVVASLSLAAAGLLPAAVLALWWPRATVWGVFAALVAGLGAGSYYLTGTTLYSVTFYDAWNALSSAGPEALAEFEELKALWVAAESEARAIAYQDMVSRAGGALWSPGLANWFGIAPAANAIIAIPVAVLAGVLVSLLTAPRVSAGAAAQTLDVAGAAASRDARATGTADA